MDEKESIPEAPSAAVSDKGDTADSEKPSSESAQEKSASGDVPDVNFDKESETNAIQSDPDPEQQNHVDHKVSVGMPSSTAKDVDCDKSVDKSEIEVDNSTDITNADDKADGKIIGKSLTSNS